MAHTNTTRKALTALIIVIAGTLFSPSTGEAATPVTGIVTENVTADDQAHYDRVIEVFEKAGFELPNFQVAFYTDSEPCQGYMGLHWIDEVGVSIINVCATHDNPMVETAHRFRTLMHEAAHAWVEQTISDETKADFLAIRGLVEWSDPSKADWADLGAEHSAEVLTWGLVENYNVHVLIDQDTPEELAPAFAVLTGTAARHGS